MVKMDGNGSIKILEIRVQTGDKPLKAFADIQLDEVTIRDFRIIKENGKRLIVATPQVSWRDKASGLIKYKTLITFSSEVKGQIDLVVLNAYHRAMEEQNANSNTD